MDFAFLDWPFFEPAHREFARGLAGWLDAQDLEKPALDINARCAWWAGILGEAGWLDRVAHPEVRTLCLAREILAFHDALADFAFAMQGLGSAPIALFGSDEQRSTYLPPIARGRSIAAFALSEAQAGSDVAAIETRARRSGGEYVITGEKTYISNAGAAAVYVLFARTGEDGAKGLSAFIVDAGTDGLECSAPVETISPHPLGTLQLRECRVRVDRRIGQEGQGFKIAMATLDMFRSTVGAAALGFAKRALTETLAHVRARRLFGQRLADMQLTQGRLAHMATEIDAAALLIYRAAYVKDRGAPRVTREAAMAKWYATEMASRVVDAAVQLFGARGVTRGSIVERLYRDTRALRIYEGASEVQQIVIARSLVEASS